MSLDRRGWSHRPISALVAAAMRVADQSRRPSPVVNTGIELHRCLFIAIEQSLKPYPI